jgi:hypothetical protein
MLTKMIRNTYQQTLTSGMNLFYEPCLVALNDPVAVMQMRSRLDEEIDELDCRSAALKRTRNSLAAACRLPAEVLCSIFLLLRDTYEPPEQSFEWIRIAHVSHYWRLTACGFPALWCKVDCRKRLWAKEALRRAHATPIHFSVTRTGDADSDFNQLLLLSTHLERVSALTVTDFTVTELRPRLHQGWTMLEQLTLLCRPSEIDNIFTKEDIGAHMPRLRKLQLRNCEFVGDQAIPMLPTLHSLHVSFSQRGWCRSSLVYFLKGASNLRRLDLIHPSIRLAVGDTTASKPLLLPNLPKFDILHLQGTASSCNEVLSLLPPPHQLLNLRIRCGYHDALQPILEYARKGWTCEQMQDGRFDCVRLLAWQERVGPTDLRFLASIQVSALGGPDALPRGVNLVIEDENKGCCHRLLRSAYQALPLTEVTTVHIGGPLDMTNALLRLHACEQLFLDKEALEFLSLTFDGNSLPPLAPKLRRLEVDGTAMSRLERGCLSRWLLARKSKGLGISQLVVMCGFKRPIWLSLFEEGSYVDEVIVK